MPAFAAKTGKWPRCACEKGKVGGTMDEGDLKWVWVVAIAFVLVALLASVRPSPCGALPCPGGEMNHNCECVMEAD